LFLGDENTFLGNIVVLEYPEKEEEEEKGEEKLIRRGDPCEKLGIDESRLIDFDRTVIGLLIRVVCFL